MSMAVIIVSFSYRQIYLSTRSLSEKNHRINAQRNHVTAPALATASPVTIIEQAKVTAATITPHEEKLYMAVENDLFVSSVKHSPSPSPVPKLAFINTISAAHLSPKRENIIDSPINSQRSAIFAHQFPPTSNPYVPALRVAKRSVLYVFSQFFFVSDVN